MERERNNYPEGQRRLESVLDQIGLGKYTSEQLELSTNKLSRAISIGMMRADEPTTEDDGVPAIPSPIQVITARQLLEVPIGREVFTVCWGGTAQRSGIGEKGPEEVYPTTLNRNPIPKAERTLNSHDFASLIGDHITKGVDQSSLKRQDVNHIKTVGVSLGVPQRNKIDSYGVNAYIDGVPSNWNITDLNNQTNLGKALTEKLNNDGLGVEQVYFQPDPTAVAHDVSYSSESNVPTLPASILGGTGTNAALFGRNLELSTTKDIFPDDKVHKKMAELGYAPEENWTKFRTGGHRIKLRVSGAMHVLADMNLISQKTASEINVAMQDRENGPLVSDIARDDLSWNEFNERYHASLRPEEYEMLRVTSKRALEQAGQVIGVMVTSVAKAAGYDERSNARLPMEGTVIKKGYGVLGSIRDTMRTLMPEHKLELYDASDFRGIAKFAMVQQMNNNIS